MFFDKHKLCVYWLNKFLTPELDFYKQRGVSNEWRSNNRVETDWASQFRDLGRYQIRRPCLRPLVCGKVVGLGLGALRPWRWSGPRWKFGGCLVQSDCLSQVALCDSSPGNAWACRSSSWRPWSDRRSGRCVPWIEKRPRRAVFLEQLYRSAHHSAPATGFLVVAGVDIGLHRLHFFEGRHYFSRNCTTVAVPGRLSSTLRSKPLFGFSKVPWFNRPAYPAIGYFLEIRGYPVVHMLS